jgi:hypothetical protein
MSGEIKQIARFCQWSIADYLESKSNAATKLRLPNGSLESVNWVRQSIEIDLQSRETPTVA